MVQGPVVLAIAEAEGAAVVEAQIARVVGVFGEIDAFFGKDLLEQLEMDRLVVDDDAIEVENNRAQHAV